MDKSAKLYTKALDKYNNGYIDKAIELCELSISLNIRNSAAINLKGLMYYLKGDLDTAQKLWKMNCHMNNDNVAKKYLESSKNDKDKLDLYNTALKLIEELRINEAIEIFLKCRESDFNSINVNNYIALCYIKKGEYDKAVKFIDKVLELDKNNDIAKINNKNLIEYGIVNKKINIKPLIIFIALIFIISSSIYFMKNNIFSKDGNILKNGVQEHKNTALNEGQDKSIKKNQDSKIKVKDNGQNKKEEVKKDVFSYKAVEAHIQSKDFNNVYNDVAKWKNKQLKTDEKAIINQGVELLQDEGVEYFYKEGGKRWEEEDYAGAKPWLLKAYEFGNKSDYYEHILYELAKSYGNLKDTDNALKYYTEYYNKFKGQCYFDIVLYDMSLLYKSKDMNKAKEYASELASDYPDSIYNNSNIWKIINNN